MRALYDHIIAAYDLKIDRATPHHRPVELALKQSWHRRFHSLLRDCFDLE